MSPLVFVFALFLVVSRPTMACNICETCRDVFVNFAQCSIFVQGLSNDPSPMCCRNIANLNAIAKQEKGGAKRICNCIEQYAKNYHHHTYDASHIQQLPIKCKTKLSFPISENMDCSSDLMTNKLSQSSSTVMIS
ncbi:hypothetical protein OROMI_019655 [Orobanche minor]